MWCVRTNIEIDDSVLHEAQKLIGTRTKRETVDVALRELVLAIGDRRARSARTRPLGGRPRQEPPRTLVIAVDTSVWIDVLNERDSPQALRASS